MEKKPPVMTPFDQMVTNEMLQTMKLMIPYLPPHLQRMAGIYAKFTELQNAIACFRPPYHDSRRRRLRQKKLDMDSFTEDLAPYLSPDVASSVENVRQAMSMMEMMQSMGNMDDMMQGMGNMGDMMQGMGSMGDMMQSMGNITDTMQDLANTSDATRFGENVNQMTPNIPKKMPNDKNSNRNSEGRTEYERMDEQPAPGGSGSGEAGTDPDGGQSDPREKRQEPGTGHDVPDHGSQ
ncbi:hypothetical protein ABXS75_11550 [Roseburia hominis]